MSERTYIPPETLASLLEVAYESGKQDGYEARKEAEDDE